MRMKLSTRLTLFFLAALAVVLVGFSVTLYVLAAKYLLRQVDERLESAVNTLVAAAEIKPSGVEWEPEERSLTFPRRALESSFRWEVVDPNGERVDGSFEGFDVRARHPRRDRRPRNAVDASGQTWRLAERWITPALARGSPAGWDAGADADLLLYPRLEIRVGLSLAGMHQTLRYLAFGLAATASTVFLLALCFGNALCRRALRPVTEMAAAAHTIDGTDLAERLPTPWTGDELEELGRSFNALLDRVAESYFRQKQFTGDASHQLRTPLTAIQGQIDVALKQERTAEEYRRVLGVLQRKARHLREIVDSLLFLARADAEVAPPSIQTIDLASWLPADLASFQDIPRARDLRISCVGCGAIYVNAQPVLLGELVHNLIENGIKYSPVGEPVDVRLSRDGAFARISVEDRGIGLSKDELEHVFDPFYRAQRAVDRAPAGLGLGLSVAARLARIFGGRIDVQSELGRGSRFTVCLPLAPPPDELTGGEVGETGQPVSGVDRPDSFDGCAEQERSAAVRSSASDSPRGETAKTAAHDEASPAGGLTRET